MATRSQGSVRMGPISLFTLVILICLAVLGLLAISTSQATYAAAERQAKFMQETYENETAAWEFVETVDEAVETVRLSGGTMDDAMAAVERAVPSDAIVSGCMVTMRFKGDLGRTLEVRIVVNNDATMSIVDWIAGMERSSDASGETLWKSFA